MKLSLETCKISKFFSYKLTQFNILKILFQTKDFLKPTNLQMSNLPSDTSNEQSKWTQVKEYVSEKWNNTKAAMSNAKEKSKEGFHTHSSTMEVKPGKDTWDATWNAPGITDKIKDKLTHNKLDDIPK